MVVADARRLEEEHPDWITGAHVHGFTAATAEQQRPGLDEEEQQAIAEAEAQAEAEAEAVAEAMLAAAGGGGASAAAAGGYGCVSI